jgi:hypothetical protein
MLELGSLDQVLADAETAAAWLEGYAAELVGGEQNLLAAGAEARGDRPLETLTAAEMARRVAAGVERGDADLRESLYTPAPDEAAAGGAPTIAQIARFARQPLSTKVAAVARGTERGLTPSEIVAASTTAGD